MNITCCPVGLLNTCCYVLWQDDRQDCLVIDPGDDAPAIRQACGQKHIAGILLTHGHFDHIGAVEALLGEDTPLAIHPLDAAMLNDPETNASWMLRRRITCPPATLPVQEGDVLELAGMSLRVLHTPGHTPGSVCYEAEGQLFTGDTLFHGGYGRTDLPGGDAAAMMTSLQRVIPMQATHTIHPGHRS